MKTSTIIAAAIGIFAAASLSADTPKADAAEAKADPKGVQAVTEIIIDTSMGTMKAELYPDQAPETVKNFLAYVDDSFYDGTIFHRVIKNFMIQGGCPRGTGTGGPGYTIKGEFARNGFRQNNLRHSRGVLSMARSMMPNSAGSQFFIMHADAPHLDGDYAAFGRVTSGMDVVDAIANTPTGFQDRPVQEQRIKRATVETFGEAYKVEKYGR